MTKFTARQIKDNVNVSRVSPVRDFFELVIKILGFLLLLYIALGLAVNLAAPRISLEMEKKIGKIFWQKLSKDTPVKPDAQIQEILNKLVRHSALPKLDYSVYVEKTEKINALALPGGRILILSGLLKEIESENELAMVLAHELGHFAHRDHLRIMGRGLVFLVLSYAVLGADSSASRFIANAISKSAGVPRL